MLIRLNLPKENKMCPEWYANYFNSLNDGTFWASQKSYLIEWKNAAGEHFLTQQYATNETDAIFKAGQMRGCGSCVEFVSIKQEN